MKSAFKKRLEAAIQMEKSPEKLAKSFAAGVFIAFSPYLGVQTLLIFLFSWVFKLNKALAFATVYLINNPFLTMIPIVILDYLVGHWIIERWLGIDLVPYNPTWLGFLQEKIGVYVNKYMSVTEVSIWAYVIGGHIVALTAMFISYPLAYAFFKRIINRHSSQNKEIKT